MLLSTRVVFKVLLLTATYVFKSSGNCNCDTTFSDDCRVPPPPAIDLCDTEFDEEEFNSLVEDITYYCNTDCLSNYLECLRGSPDCADELQKYETSLCETYNGNFCWVLFARVTNEMILNCTNSRDPCEGAEENGTSYCEDYDCQSNLEETSNDLGCCATLFFNEAPFERRPSTNESVYATCSVSLTPESECSPTIPTTTPTDSAARDILSFINIAVIVTVAFVATNI